MIGPAAGRSRTSAKALRPADPGMVTTWGRRRVATNGRDGTGRAPAHLLLTPAELGTARRSPLLAHLPEALEARLLQGARPQGYQAGQIIFQQDTMPEALFVVLDGWVKTYRLTAGGAETVVSTLHEGQSLGETAAICGQRRHVSAEAITPARLLRLDAGHVRRLVQSEPALAAAMLVPALTHLEHLVAHVEELKAHTGVQRVAGFLLTLAGKCEGRCSVALPYSKALLAGQLGMKPETLSRALARLRDHGVRTDSTVVHIEDIDRLRDLMTEKVG